VVILGVNAYHGDAAACLLNDGQLVAAAEEERFCRVKHWAGFPARAIRYCLDEGGAGIDDVDVVAINRNPRANVIHKLTYALSKKPSLSLVLDRFRNARKVKNVREDLSRALHVPPERISAQVCHVEHHVAHLASSYYVSPFREAALVSVDGFGDFISTMWGTAADNQITVSGRVLFPHSLGLFYLAITQYLGFTHYGDEYKVMGLAAYGKPTMMEEMRQIVRLQPNGTFRLGLDYFNHHSEGVMMTWDGGAPTMGKVYTRALEELLGPARAYEESIEKRHEDIASSVQQMYEEAYFHLLNKVHRETGLDNLCVAGGCALNSVANGKIFSRTPFKEVYIQPAAGDAGGALGAALYAWHAVLGNSSRFTLRHAFWGPSFEDQRIPQALREREEDLAGCELQHFDSDGELCKFVAREIAGGKIVGWFQGRMEWGPRALGNRSILVDPRQREMVDRLNARIKRRESFRPFAPSILLEATGEYLEIDYPDPFMLKVYKIKPGKRAVIPAVTHVDGTGRLQTVAREENPLFWCLIKEFEKLTGVPVVLNTSFNENEPIVCTPQEALDCFLRTEMDVLVLGRQVVRRLC